MNVLLVDGFNLVRRIYEARPASADPSETVTAIKQSVQRALKQHDPTHAVVVFEEHDKTWRHLLYPEYKANRSPTPADLLAMLDDIRTGIESLGVATLSISNYEADDVIATLVSGISGHGSATILSTDKAYLQLLGEGVQVYNHFDNVAVPVDEAQARFQVRINQLVDFWALAGDRGNNVKGVPGIGEKSAVVLLQQFGTLEAVLAASSDDKLVKKAQAAAELATRCRQLVTLKRDVDLGVNLKDFRLRH